MSEYKISISPELVILFNVKELDLEHLISVALEEGLVPEFICGDEITQNDIRGWLKVEEIKK